MTLVVARVIGDEIRIISDTKITDTSVLHSTLLDGALKCIAVSPTCCVSYAGNVAYAKEALASILNHTIRDRDQITTHLLQHHKAAGGKTDFIVAFAGTSVAIDRVADQKVEANLDAAWIGDYSAFCTYQDRYHSPGHVSVALDPSFQVATQMQDAFKAVIEDDLQSRSVGHFSVTVTSRPVEDDGFRYLPHQGASGFQSVPLKTTPVSLLRSLGVEGGSFVRRMGYPRQSTCRGSGPRRLQT
jgi:hypothetical protein